MSYYLSAISSHMEWLNDNGKPMYNHPDIKQIKADIMKWKPRNLATIKMRDDVKQQIGIDVSKDHKNFYYISDFASVFTYHHMKQFVKELEDILPTVESEILKNVLQSLIRTYSDDDWLFKYHYPEMKSLKGDEPK